MATQSSPSFIPKQPPRGNKGKRSTRKIYILTYVSFVFFFGTLITSGATFFYKLNTQSQLEAEKQNIIAQRQRFDQASFERVKEFNNKLDSANELLNQHVSVLSILEALEKATISSVQISSFEMDRAKRNSIELTLQATTKDFNSVLFQRDVYEQNPILQGSNIFDLSLTKSVPDKLALGAPKQIVSLSLVKEFSPSDITYTPRNTGPTLVDVDFTDTETGTSTPEGEGVSEDGEEITETEGNTETATDQEQGTSTADNIDNGAQ